jgi:hypothetical protein
LLPEGGDKALPVLVFIAAPDVIDENVEAALLLFHAVKQSCDLGVHRMVAALGNPMSTSLRDRVRSFSDSAGKTFGCAALVTAPRDVDRRARFAEHEGNALADATTGPADDCHSFAQQ